MSLLADPPTKFDNAPPEVREVYYYQRSLSNEDLLTFFRSKEFSQFAIQWKWIFCDLDRSEWKVDLGIVS